MDLAVAIFDLWRGRSAFQCMELNQMKQTTGVFAVLTAALLLGGTLGVGCGGDDDNGSGGAGGSGGSAGSGTAGKAGSVGSTCGSGGTGGSTGGTGGTTDGGGIAGSAGSAGADGGGDASTTVQCGTSTCGPV